VDVGKLSASSPPPAADAWRPVPPPSLRAPRPAAPRPRRPIPCAPPASASRGPPGGHIQRVGGFGGESAELLGPIVEDSGVGVGVAGAARVAAGGEEHGGNCKKARRDQHGARCSTHGCSPGAQALRLCALCCEVVNAMASEEEARVSVLCWPRCRGNPHGRGSPASI